MELSQIMTLNLDPDVILMQQANKGGGGLSSPRDQQLLAKKVRESVKNARLAEGPKDSAVYDISRRLEAVLTQRDADKTEYFFDPARVTQATEVNERIRRGIKIEGEILKEAIENGEYSEPVYKPRPGIKPMQGTLPVKPSQGRHRGPAKLGDMVSMSSSANLLHSAG